MRPASEMEPRVIEQTDHGRVRELRLARPPANAFNTGLMRELATRVLRAPADGADALVISGAPGMFTGGLDVPELLRLGPAEVRSFWEAFFALLRGVAASEVPVVAALTGHSPAAGAVLAAFCDYRVMADGPYKVGMNEVQVGLVVPPLIQYAMKRLAGPRVGDALLVSGAMLAPREALRVGLVDQVVAPAEVVPHAVAWAEALLALPRQAMLETRRLARADLVAQFDALGPRAHEEAAERVLGAEAQAAMRALAERLARK
jgi:enoyl-CoA hydratase/carnithine racemase